MGRKKGSWTGQQNPRWKGGRFTDSKGIVHVKVPDHPLANNNGYVVESRLVMSNIIGRPLFSLELVHHRNGNPTDNRPENLVLITRQKHASIHHKGLIKPKSIANLRPMTSAKARTIWNCSRTAQRSTPKVCELCGNEFHRKGKPRHKHVFCGRRCYGRWVTHVRGQSQSLPE